MFKSVVEYLGEHAEQRGNAPAYGEKIDGRWQMATWSEYYGQIRRCARALIGLGIQDGGRVAILGDNRPQWAVSCLGTMCARAVSVGIYQTNSPDQVAYILNHAETPVAIVEDRAQAAKIDAVRDRLPHLRHVVLMTVDSVDGDSVDGDSMDGDGSDPDEKEPPFLLGWQDFLTVADSVPEADLDGRLKAIGADDVATFIYTSGTTAEPKAVMLSHGNLVETSKIGNEIHGFGSDDSIISYLPLAHVAEQMMSVHMPAFIAYTVYYADAPEHLPDYLQELQPTIFFAVPRVWERFYAKILERLQQSSPVARGMVSWAVGNGKRYSEALNDGRRPGLAGGLGWRLADAVVARKLRRRLGLGNLRLAASGAAPIRSEIL